MSDRRESDALSATQTLRLVRWDYRPDDEGEASLSVAAGAFFQEFPWEPSPEGGGPPDGKKPAD